MDLIAEDGGCYVAWSQMGLLPCPTLAMVLGAGLSAQGFGSRAWALVTGAVEEEAPKWQADVSAAMADSRSKEDAIAAFVRAILELVKAGRHELPFALASGDLDAGARESMNKAHQGLFMLIVPALKEMGVRDAVSCVEMIGGVVTAAAQALRRDKKRRGLIDLAVGFAVGGVRACVKRG